MTEKSNNNEENLEIEVSEDSEKESYLDFYDRKYLEEQENNRIFESVHSSDFLNIDIHNLELKQFIKETIEVLKKNKKKCEKELYAIPDVRTFSKKEIEQIYTELKKSDELKAIKKEVYTSLDRSKALIKSLRKSYVTGVLTVGFKEDSDNVIYMIIENAIKKRIKKINSLIDERIRIINSDLKKMNFIKDIIDYPVVDFNEIAKNINSLSADSIVKSSLLEKAQNYCEEQEKNRLIREQERLIKQEKREKEIKEQKERERKEQEELEQLKRLEIETESKDAVKLFDINGYEYVRKIIDDYEFLFPDGILNLNIEDSFNYEELRQIINFDFIDIDDEIFTTTLLTLLAKVDKSDDKIREKLSTYLKVLCVKYELYCRVKNILDDINSIKVMTYLTSDEMEILENFKEQINKIKYCNNTLLTINLLDKIQETLYNIKATSRSKNISSEKVFVKAFILFDYKIDENDYKESYVVTDLNTNKSDNMIDESIDQEKIVSCGYNDFNELIDDILLLGNAEIMTQPNDKSSKIVRSVYYSTGYNKPIDNKKENATGMRRIRPRMTSYLRFIDEKVLFIQGTKKYIQIKELIENKMPGLIIDETRPLGLFINYLNAFKRKDIDGYSIAKKRQKSSELRNVLKKPCDEFSEEDLLILSDAIDLTLESFDLLTNINDNFEFGVINQIKNNNRKFI